MSELWQLDAHTAVHGLRNGEISIHQLLDAAETRINQVDAVVNALPTLCFERARKEADRLQALAPGDRGVLAGLPITIKDLTDVAGVRTTYGSMIYQSHVPNRSDRLVARMEQRGGIVYAKSNTPEFGTGGISFNDVFGFTRSPRNTRFASGGSSGGAAASLACGCAWLSHGSDMAGSLRTPAAFCGVTSLRPSPGRISSDSPYTPFDVLGQEGPMARTITDLALFCQAMFDQPGIALNEPLKAVAPRRVALSQDLNITQVSDDMKSGLDQLATQLANDGVEVRNDQPDLSGAHDCFDILRAHSYAINMEQTLKQHPGVMKAEVEWNINSGLEKTAADIRHGQRLQGAIVSRAEAFMEHYDLLICPATSVSSVSAELRYPGSDGAVGIPDYYRWLAIGYATTMTALPIVTLPVGLTEEGMPIAVQLIGRPGSEVTLLQHARWIEQQSNWNPVPIEPVCPGP